MNATALAKALEDVAAVIVTPMHADLSIDEAGLRAHVRAMADAGVRVIVPAGNTGEFYALTREENERVIRITCEEVGKRALVLAGVGYSVPDSIALARVAERAGAKAVMIHQPICPYVHPDGLARYVTTIADAIGIGVVLYVKDPNVTPAMLGPALNHPGVVGVKYAVNDPQKVGAFTAAFPAEKHNVAWLCGTAEAWAPFFWTAGCRGFTSGLVNIAPRLALDMLDALRAGEPARVQSLWRLLKPIEDLRAKHGAGNNVAVVKAGMAMAGVKVGGVRPPSAPMRDEDRAALAAILESWGVLRRQAAE